MVVNRRILRRLVAVSISMLVLVAPVGVASAGGSTWTFDRPHYQPGDTAFGWAPIAWEHDPALGTPEQGPYFASVALIPPSGPVPGQPIDISAVPVGEITVSLEPYGDGPVRFGPHHAEITFTVPDLPPGHYELLHANAVGKTLGDLTWGTFWIDAAGTPRPTVILSGPTFAG